MPNEKFNIEKFNIIEFLVLDDYEFVTHAIKQIYNREPLTSEIDEHLYNLKSGQTNKISILRLLTKSSEGIKNSTYVKGVFLYAAINRARKLPLIGILFKPFFYLIHVPVLVNKTERDRSSFNEDSSFVKDKLHGLESVFVDNKQKLVDLYLHIGRISRYNKRLENTLSKDIANIQINGKQLSTTLETLTDRLSRFDAKIGALETHIKKIDNLKNEIQSLKHQYSDRFEGLKEELNAKTIKNHELFEQLLHDHNKIVHDIDSIQNDSAQKYQTLSQRTEFIREELLYEFRYADRTEKKKDKIEIINKKKYQEIKKNIKINVGCGHLPLEGYLNIDQRRLPNVDIVTDALNLPFDKESISELYSAHLIEHFPEEKFKRVILPYWYSLIKKGGFLKLAFPDFETMAKKYIKEDYPFEKFRKVIFGVQDYDGDYHFNMFTKETISTFLYEIGFKKVDIPVTGRRNGDCYEMMVNAQK